MARPSQYPEWASTETNVVEPTEAKKDAGWLDGERPPAGWFNWLLNLIYKWIVSIIEDDIDPLTSGLASEITNRTNADSSLQTNIESETDSRVAGDSALTDSINTVIGNLNSEISTRGSADTALSDRIDDYDDDTTEYSGTMTLEEDGTNSGTINYLGYVRRIRGSSNTMEIVEIWLPETMFTSTNQYLLIDGTTIPSAFRPESARESVVHMVVVDNAGYEAGYMVVTNTGDWQIHLYSGSVFTSSSSKGIGAQVIRFIKQIS